MSEIKRHITSHGVMCDSAEVADLEASHADILEALQTLTLVIGLTPIAGNKEALQQAFGIACSAIAKAEGESKL